MAEGWSGKPSTSVLPGNAPRDTDDEEADLEELEAAEEVLRSARAANEAASERAAETGEKPVITPSDVGFVKPGEQQVSAERIAAILGQAQQQTIPSAQVALDQPPEILTRIPDEVVAQGPEAIGKYTKIIDKGAQTREQRISPKQEKREESAEMRWRRMLGELNTTEFIHMKLRRRKLNGSYIGLGGRYNISVNEVREYEQLVPYAGRWALGICRSTDRADNPDSWRWFEFEREGPEAPLGFSMDNPLDEEVDMATGREIVLQTLQEVAAGRAPGAVAAAPAAAPQQQLSPFGMPPQGFYGYPGYPGGYPPPPPPPAPVPAGRSEEDRREREEERKRQEAREAKFEAMILASQTAHKTELDAIQRSLGEERTARVQAENLAREAREAGQRDSREAAHRADMMSVTSTLDALKRELLDIRNKPAEQPKQHDLAILGTTVVPLLTQYLSGERESRSDDRRMRLEELTRERERMAGESERLNRVFTMMTDSQMNNAKASTEMISRLQDPGAMMSMTKLLNETIGGNVQLLATLSKSGMLGGGGGEKVNVGELIGQGLQAAGDMMSAYADMQTKKMEILASQGLPANGLPPQAYQPQPQPQPQPVAIPRASAPAAVAKQPAGQPVGQGMLKGMVDTIVAAVGRQHNPPEEVADMIAAMVHALEAFKMQKANPTIYAFVEAVKVNPEQALRANFPQANPRYIALVAKAIVAKYGQAEAGDEDAGAEDGAGNGGTAVQQPIPIGPLHVPGTPFAAPTLVQLLAPPSSPPVAVVAQAPVAPPQPLIDLQAGAAPAVAGGTVVPMPSKRGRGRPRKTDPQTTTAPVAVHPQQTTLPIVAPPVPPPQEAPVTTSPVSEPPAQA